MLRTGLGLYALLALGVFLLTGALGYVYSHEPVRDMLVLDLQRTATPAPSTLAGSVVAIEDGTLTLVLTDGAQATVTLPAGVPLEDLARLEAALPRGATVNVGVDNTRFGQVLTGVVWVQDVP